MGRIAVLAVRNQDVNETEPLMLISLNSSDKVTTEELQTKVGSPWGCLRVWL